jgi:hypothetical protein
MTRTFCDRCDVEGKVKQVALVERTMLSDGIQHADMTMRAVDLCEACIVAVKRAFEPSPQCAPSAR